MVKVSVKVRVRVGIQGWNMCYRRSIILFDFMHNPARSIRTQTITFRVPMERVTNHQYIPSGVRMGRSRL